MRKRSTKKWILSGIIIWLYMWYIFHYKFMLPRVQCWDNKTQFPDSDIKLNNLISFVYMIYFKLIFGSLKQSYIWWQMFRVYSRKVLYFTQHYFDFNLPIHLLSKFTQCLLLIHVICIRPSARKAPLSLDLCIHCW